ncbi:TonB-dependent siderophore receptor [Sphingorhabdus sp. EL138]|uniref:TonB-dependent receptor plug domain-containing protein n=1 Tax=Sphingorhabdus sp. EL138 TaxID=2073156 RepID=UPI000D695383|nr:TonB-dependent receptor [Sphingorhabdus sp. EL138]
MKKFTKLKSGAAPLVLGLAMVSAPAYAQDQEAETSEDDIIIVTGSLISNPNLERSSPVIATNADEIELKISTNAEELIRDIPGLVSGIGSNANNGNNGTATIDLRALGSNRNLGLLDGTRVVPNDLAGQFDLNNVPLALIERVDVLTGGASTTYGADAIAGVVNFITKKDFAGFELEVSEQITEEGDGNIFRIDATIGANFDDGRGNVVLSLGYQDRDAVFQGDRDFSTFNIGSFNGQPGGSTTTVPAAFSFACAGLNPCPEDGTNFSGNRQVNPASGGLNDTIGLFNFNPFNLFQTPFERFNIYAAGNYEITDTIEVYSRGLFSKNNVSTIIAPSGSFGSNQTININNPFIPVALRNAFCANNDFDPNTAGIQTLDAATCLAAATDPNGPTLADGSANPNYQTFQTNLRRRTVEVGPRLGDYSTTLFDYKIGFRGALTDAIDWDIFGSYGESSRILTQDNYVLNSRLGPTLQTVDGVTCVDTTAAAGCVPANVFGAEGDISPEAASYIRGRSTTERRASLAQVRATISGDSGFAVPFAEDNVSFAIGGEYRNNTGFQQADSLAETPGELGGAGGAAVPIRGSYDVYEAFGELVVPVVQDKPFFDDLTLEAGIRYSDYTIEAASNPGYSTTTWKVGGSWTPDANLGLKIRGGFNRAVRAPNIGELFTPVATVLTNLLTDPCQGNAPTNDLSGNLSAVCQAQGAPAFTVGNIPPPVSGQVNITTGGNIDLQPETADTYTVGFVFQPEFVPGFSMTVDYYNISITDAITTATPGDLISACFDNITAASATDPACTQIGRNPFDGGLSGDPSNTPGLFGALSNLGTLETDGIDFSFNYKRDIGFAELTLGLNGNWTNSTTFQATPTSINRECVGFYSVNCSAFSGAIQPEWTFSQRTTLSFPDVDVSLLWRYIDGVQYEPLQQLTDLAGALASNVDDMGVLLPVADQGCPDFEGADPGGCIVDPAFRSIGSAHYFDLSARWQVMDNLQMTFLVQNLFDKSPPIVGADVGSTTFNNGNTYSSTYDALGRRFGVSAKVTF